jgi:hypothetical protein
MAQAGVNNPDIRGVLDAIRRRDDRVFADPNNLSALMDSAAKALKQVEFDIRTKLDGGDQPLSLSAGDEVPESFRAAIAEYFRSLPKK